MGFRHWLRHQLSGETASDDVPPGRSLLTTLWGREEERIRALGEYSSTSYPTELTELLTRRQQVADEVLAIDISDRDARIEAIPRLRELLRTYPHPLVYETLIHAYVDAGRYDEARGVAFAARERRIECRRSEHPEIRSEVDHLAEWTPDDVEELRQQREAANGRSAEG
jgi:pentatricopeptide repeat protein